MESKKFSSRKPRGARTFAQIVAEDLIFCCEYHREDFSALRWSDLETPILLECACWLVSSSEHELFELTVGEVEVQVPLENMLESVAGDVRPLAWGG